MSASSSFDLRPLTPADWPAVCAIYLEGIATGQATFETDAPEWQEWDAAHLSQPRLAAEIDGTVVGWAALSPVSRRAAYVGVAEVSLYVAAAQRGRGIGRALLAALISQSEAHGLWTLQASIFPENSVSLRVHAAYGFRVVGRRERIAQHNGRWRDVYLLERRSPAISDNVGL